MPRTCARWNSKTFARFFRTYYHPANASLALAGDIDSERGFELAEAYFGDIPRGDKPSSVHADASVAREVRLVLEDRVELPRVYMAWHSPAMFADEDAEADLLADLLANGKTSRLYRTLVYDKRMALDVSAYQHSREISSFFLLASTAAPGQSLTEITALIDQRIQQLADEGPVAEEMERGLAQAEAHFMYRCRPSAALAASPISSMPTTSSKVIRISSPTISPAIKERHANRSAPPRASISRSIGASC
jgi:zinc protease